MAEPAVHELVNSESDIEIIWRAFELRPEPVPTLPPDGEYLHRVWNSSVYPMAESLGVVMKLPPVQPRSRLAHEAAHWARTMGKFEAMNAAIFRAFFERGENIGEIDVLISLASRLNLETDSLRRALESKEFEASVIAEEKEAEMVSLSGVPAFVANRKFALSGVQPLENLKMLVERASVWQMNFRD
ncbi:MAG: DsbA family protein [Acidobacteria bacterium]|nr:DsbA family protein [Acidobacteriota bacterium]MCA1639490.1 DsbA family protein [Acidobacteriota bacterium]